MSCESFNYSQFDNGPKPGIDGGQTRKRFFHKLETLGLQIIPARRFLQLYLCGAPVERPRVIYQEMLHNV